VARACGLPLGHGAQNISVFYSRLDCLLLVYNSACSACWHGLPYWPSLSSSWVGGLLPLAGAFACYHTRAFPTACFCLSFLWRPSCRVPKAQVLSLPSLPPGTLLCLLLLPSGLDAFYLPSACMPVLLPPIAAVTAVSLAFIHCIWCGFSVPLVHAVPAAIQVIAPTSLWQTSAGTHALFISCVCFSVA